MARKSADAFRTISEVADWLGVQPHVLRFWESKFSQVKPVKRAGGRRYYRPQDMLLLGGIRKLLHGDGLTIKGAQKILREEGVAHVSAMSHPLDGDVGEAPTAAAPAPVEAPAPEPVEEDVASLPAFLTNPAKAPAEPAEAETPAELPSFLRSATDEDAPAAPVAAAPEPEEDAEEVPVAPVRRPTIVQAPDPDEAAIEVGPGLLSTAFGVNTLTPNQRARLMPMIAELAALRDRMAAER